MSRNDKVGVSAIVALLLFCLTLILIGCQATKQIQRVVSRPMTNAVPPMPPVVVMRKAILPQFVLPPKPHTNYVRLLYPSYCHPSNEAWIVQTSTDLLSWRNAATNYPMSTQAFAWFSMVATGRCGYVRLKKL